MSKNKNKNTLLISLIIFGFPLFIFLGGYFIKNKNDFDKIYNRSSHIEDGETSVFHTINDVSFIVAGNIKRLGSNKLEARNLKIYDRKSKNLLFSCPKLFKARIDLSKIDIKITEILTIRLDKNNEKEFILSQRKISLDKNRNINLATKKIRLGSYNILPGLIDNFKSEVLKYRSKNTSLRLNKNQLKSFLSKLLICAINGDKNSMKILANLQAKLSNELVKELYQWLLQMNHS